MKRTLLSIIVVLTVAGCAKSPFSTRPAEDPVGGKGTYITPIDPLIALDNLRYAMIEQNLGHYIQTYADSFTFTFDFLLADRPDTASGWGASEESRIAGNLLGVEDSITLDWGQTEGRSDLFEDSTAFLYRTYAIELVRDSADIEITDTYQGELIIRMRRNTLDLWSIVHWEDRHISADVSSWADLKSTYR